MSNFDEYDFSVYCLAGYHQEYAEFYFEADSYEIGDQQKREESDNSILHIASANSDVPSSSSSNHEPSLSSTTSKKKTTKAQKNPVQEKAIKARNDPLTHNLAQNLSSSIKTKLLKILSVRWKKPDKMKLKEKYEKFLEENGAKNNGLIILFAYLFMRRENATPEQMQQLQVAVIGFLNVKMSEASKVDIKEEETYLQKLRIHKKLAERYLDGCNKTIDVEWVRNVSSGLFTGRQEKVITKPLATLENIQKSLMSSSLDSLSQQYLIQSFFENSSRE